MSRFTPALLLPLALSLAGVMLAIAPAALQAADTNVLTPQLVAELKTVAEVALSPDGTQVAFVRSVPRKPGLDEDGEAWNELHVARRRDRTESAFITGKVNVQKVSWTQDASHLVFLSKRGDDKFKSLYRIALGGGEARRALTLKNDIADYSLSPDGARVVTVSLPAENESRKKLKEKGFKQEIFEEDWENARAWISRFPEDAATNAVPLQTEGAVRQVHWSPAGDRIAVVTTPTPSVDDSLMRQQVQIFDPATGTRLLTLDHSGKLGALAWAPDGRHLALIAGADEHDPSAGRLLLAPVTDGKPRDLLPAFEGEVTHVAWRNASTLLFAAGVGTKSMIGEVTLAAPATPYRVLTPSDACPIVTALSVSRDGQSAAFAGHTARHPAEAFALDLTAPAQPTRLTSSDPNLARLRFARQEVIRHRARDGLELEGILVHPLEEQPGTRYPLLLTVHGGPEAHVSDGWITSYSNPGQVAAARGFAVFYPNYRGSTGRGVAFSQLGQGDAAGKEFDDLVDAVDHLVAIGLVDTTKVGVTGGSYGGYATAWCSTRYSERFAAGVMFVGISDKLSKVGTTDIPDEEYLVHARKRPWDDWQFLLERSPIYHAGNARTPLLILHGADDPRVHPGQSKEMYRHLKLRSRAPVRLVLYPGEGHGNRKAAARYDYHLRMLQWFEHYLVGPRGPMPAFDLDYGLPAN
ncbi:MAG: S9 family peptidase [Verrucomicrobiales bacterium]|nr:S9 family peptidase [Verrucomicrobiales bacterium]